MTGTDLAQALAALRAALLAWIDAAGTAGSAAGDTRHGLADRLAAPLYDAGAAIYDATDRHASQSHAALIEAARAGVVAAFARRGAAPAETGRER
jgi:hypothetical protein